MPQTHARAAGERWPPEELAPGMVMRVVGGGFVLASAWREQQLREGIAGKSSLQVTSRKHIIVLRQGTELGDELRRQRESCRLWALDLVSAGL